MYQLALFPPPKRISDDFTDTNSTYTYLFVSMIANERDPFIEISCQGRVVQVQMIAVQQIICEVEKLTTLLRMLNSEWN
jgi:hypothetical protein